MSSQTYPIVVEGVTKRYGDFTAVDDISFQVPQGTIFGVLGPNGAGKTTTIRMIMNITIPDSGRVLILGHPSTEGASRLIGYLPEERGLYRKMKVLDHIVFLGEIRGVAAKEAKKRGLEWLERLRLTEWADKKVEELSKGMQQKIQFIGCVIHDPQVLIVDEPFSGLDPVNTRDLKNLFLEFRDRGKTILLCTHVMEQAEKLCDEIALINRSKIVLRGPLGEVRRQFSGNRVRLTGEGTEASLRSVPGVRNVIPGSGHVDVELEESASRSEFLKAAASAWALESAVTYEASLDDVFISAVGQSVHAVEAASGKEIPA